MPGVCGFSALRRGLSLPTDDPKEADGSCCHVQPDVATNMIAASNPRSSTISDAIAVKDHTNSSFELTYRRTVFIASLKPGRVLSVRISKPVICIHQTGSLRSKLLTTGSHEELGRHFVAERVCSGQIGHLYTSYRSVKDLPAQPVVHGGEPHTYFYKSIHFLFASLDSAPNEITQEDQSSTENCSKQCQYTLHFICSARYLSSTESQGEAPGRCKRALSARFEAGRAPPHALTTPRPPPGIVSSRSCPDCREPRSTPPF
ncbi:hypothetical protein SUDANB132_00330 [Streptomyces sp. enrichment culture]